MTYNYVAPGWGVSCALYALAASMTLLRVFTRGILFRKLGLDDYLAVIATIFAAICIYFHYTLIDVNRQFRHEIAMSKPPTASFARLDELSEIALERQFTIGSLYPPTLGLLKLSIVAFFLRFMQCGPYRKTVYVVGVGIGLFTIAATLASIFRCQPVTAAWKGGQMFPAECSLRIDILHISISAINLLTDVILLLLPIRLVINLQMNTRKKAGLVVIFAFGILGTAATAVRLSVLVAASRVRHISWKHTINIFLASQIEISVVIMCANLPACATFWRDIVMKGKKSSSTSPMAARYPELNQLELRRRQERGSITASTYAAAGPAARDFLTASQELIVADEKHIVTSTRVDVSVT